MIEQSGHDQTIVLAVHGEKYVQCARPLGFGHLQRVYDIQYWTCAQHLEQYYLVILTSQLRYHPTPAIHSVRESVQTLKDAKRGCHIPTQLAVSDPFSLSSRNNLSSFVLHAHGNILFAGALVLQNDLDRQLVLGMSTRIRCSSIIPRKHPRTNVQCPNAALK